MQLRCSSVAASVTVDLGPSFQRKASFSEPQLVPADTPSLSDFPGLDFASHQARLHLFTSKVPVERPRSLDLEFTLSTVTHAAEPQRVSGYSGLDAAFAHNLMPELSCDSAHDPTYPGSGQDRSVTPLKLSILPVVSENCET